MTPQARALIVTTIGELMNSNSAAEIHHVSRRLLVHSFALKTKEEREAFALSSPQHRLPPGWGIEGISQSSSNSNTQERKETSVTTKPSISLEAYDYDQIWTEH